MSAGPAHQRPQLAATSGNGRAWQRTTWNFELQEADPQRLGTLLPAFTESGSARQVQNDCSRIAAKGAAMARVSAGQRTRSKRRGHHEGTEPFQRSDAR